MAVEVKEQFGYVIDTEMPEIASREFVKHVHFKIIDGIGVGDSANRQFAKDSRLFLISGGRAFHNNRVDLISHSAWAVTGRSVSTINANLTAAIIQGRSVDRPYVGTTNFYAIEIL